MIDEEEIGISGRSNVESGKGDFQLTSPLHPATRRWRLMPKSDGGGELGWKAKAVENVTSEGAQTP